MAALEAVMGQLYLTVLVARLVGLHIGTGATHARGTKIDVLAGFASRSRFCCPRLTSV